MNVLIEKNEQITTLTLNRPKALNSLNDELVEEALDALEGLEKDADLRALVVAGAGKAFCAGGDLNYIKNNLTDAASAGHFISRVGELVVRLHKLPCPTVAMVGGVAAGAGANLALACDIIYCSVSARFGQSFTKVGLIPDAGGHYLLPRAIGLARAKELMFTGDLVNASSALDLGLVNKVFDDDQLEAAVYALASTLAAGPPLALAAVKRNLNLSLECSLEQMLAMETAGQSLAILSEDGREGMAAFVEKRMPVFKGK